MNKTNKLPTTENNNEIVDQYWEHIQKLDKSLIQKIVENSKKDTELLAKLSENTTIDAKLNNLELASSFWVESLIRTVIATANDWEWKYEKSNWWASVWVNLRKVFKNDDDKKKKVKKQISIEKKNKIKSIKKSKK